MRVLLCLPDFAGCGHYRLIYPGQAAVRAGAENVRAIQNWKNVTLKDDPDGTQHVLDLPDPDVDVVVMGRPLRRANVEMISILQKKGIAVVVDVDDDFDTVDARHKYWSNMQPQTSPDANRVLLHEACRRADLVTVTTESLTRRYGGHGRVRVLPNMVPRSMFGVVPEKPRDDRTIGWCGHTATHPRDLTVTRGGVAMAMRETGAKFLHIGTPELVMEQLEIPAAMDFESTGVRKFEDYPYAVARFTVGIVPLADTVFNHAKSWLKGLEMASLGVPFVATATPEYRKLGLGALIEKPKAKLWARELKRLLRDPALREEHAERGRELVREKYVYEDQGHQWLEAWEEAMKRRGGPRWRPAPKPVVMA